MHRPPVSSPVQCDQNRGLQGSDRAYIPGDSLEEEEEDEEDLMGPPSFILPEGTCDLCRKTFPSDMALLHHVNTEHLNVYCEYTESPDEWVFPKGTLFQCRHCTKTLQHSAALIQHCTEKHPSHPPPTRKSDLLIIEGKKCDLCGKHFISEAILAAHKRSEHSAFHAEKPFRCEECVPVGRDFADPIVLLTHVLNVHGEERGSLVGQAAKTGEFDCFFCDKTTTSLSALAGHITARHPKLGVGTNSVSFKKCFGDEGFEIILCRNQGCRCKFVKREHEQLHQTRCPAVVARKAKLHYVR